MCVCVCVCVCVLDPFTFVSMTACLRAELEHNPVHSVHIVQFPCEFFLINLLSNQHVKFNMFNLLMIWFYSLYRISVYNFFFF